MKSTLFVSLISFACALRISDQDPTEFELRKQELEDAQKERLTSKWMNRIDNYDPDLDQEMANDVLNASKRDAAIKRLQAKVDSFKLKGYGDWEDLETSKSMLDALKKEQAAAIKKSEKLGPNDFDA